MLIHFEFRGEHGWESMGSGIGGGADRLVAAIEDLRRLHGGAIPAGRYRYIEARAGDARFADFELDADGEIVG